MDRANEIFSLFEGVCPANGCGLGVQLIRASGNKQFIVDQGWVMETPEIEFQVRAEGVDLGDIGDVEFRCHNNHSFTIGYSEHGEWL
jgi:hypothetical protein